jgi:hypothetical protein
MSAQLGHYIKPTDSTVEHPHGDPTDIGEQFTEFTRPPKPLANYAIDAAPAAVLSMQSDGKTCIAQLNSVKELPKVKYESSVKSASGKRRYHPYRGGADNRPVNMDVSKFDGQPLQAPYRLEDIYNKPLREMTLSEFERFFMNKEAPMQTRVPQGWICKDIKHPGGQVATLPRGSVFIKLNNGRIIPNNIDLKMVIKGIKENKLWIMTNPVRMFICNNLYIPAAQREQGQAQPQNHHGLILEENPDHQLTAANAGAHGYLVEAARVRGEREEEEDYRAAVPRHIYLRNVPFFRVGSGTDFAFCMLARAIKFKCLPKSPPKLSNGDKYFKGRLPLRVHLRINRGGYLVYNTEDPAYDDLIDTPEEYYTHGDKDHDYFEPLTVKEVLTYFSNNQQLINAAGRR